MWRGHVESVTSITLVEENKLILTSSLDCTVRLWTLEGEYVGTYEKGFINKGLTISELHYLSHNTNDTSKRFDNKSMNLSLGCMIFFQSLAKDKGK